MLNKNTNEIDKLYSRLNITKTSQPVRKTINIGTMNNHLHSDFTAICGKSNKMIWSNSVNKL